MGPAPHTYMNGSDHLGAADFKMGMILKWILIYSLLCGNVDWINLAQDMFKWQAVLNVIIKFWIL
jgi:hypothetical protein